MQVSYSFTGIYILLYLIILITSICLYGSTKITKLCIFFQDLLDTNDIIVPTSSRDHYIVTNENHLTAQSCFSLTACQAEKKRSKQTIWLNKTLARSVCYVCRHGISTFGVLSWEMHVCLFLEYVFHM